MASEGTLIDSKGGYPSLVLDQKEKPIVFYQSEAFDVTEKKPQKIMGIRAGDDRKSWSVPFVVSDEAQTPIVQIPRAAMDNQGKMNVCWNGRTSEESIWGIYLSRNEGTIWSSPRRISCEGENARAPVLLFGKNNDLWFSWHSGCGNDLRIKVLNMTNSEVFPR